jgi:hypothetical protein
VRTVQDIERAMAERACEQLAIAYALHLDFGNYDAVARLFAPNATLHLDDVCHSGHEAIHNQLRERYAPYVTRHVCSNIFIDVVDDERAVGVTYLTLYRHGHNGFVPREALGIRGPSLVGHYEDEFLRMHSGWRFASRRLNVRFRRIREGQGRSHATG